MCFSDMFGKMAPELIHQHYQAHTTACGQFDQGRYWERPGVHYSVNGFNTRTPVLRKSASLRVTTVRSWISAVAAICLSKAFSGCGTLRRPHSCAMSVSISNIKSWYSLSSASNHSSNRPAWRLSPRWRRSSMPRRSSPIVITERKTGVRSLMTRRKNWRTPLLALMRFLASLMTLVSIKYMICLVLILSPLEVLVFSDIWHGGQDFGKALL